MAFTDDAPIDLIKKKKKPKYRNKKTVVDGIKFDSEKEADRWKMLKMLQGAGDIHALRRQVSVPIVVKGQKICKWIADFTYIFDGKSVFEDVKSEMTRKIAVYRLKKKLVKACHGIEIREV